jgi:uncharacterized protein involved in outer membrane biogenesis
VSRGRRIALGVAGVGVAGVAIVVGLGAVIATHGDALLAAVGRGIGRRVEAEHLSLGVRGGLGVALRGVRIADDPAFGSAEPFLVADRFDLRVRLLPLLRGRLVVDRITIDAPVVNLLRDAAGRLNVDSLGKRGEAADAPEAGDAKGGAPPLQLLALRLRNGAVRYRELANGRTLLLDDIALDAREPHFAGPVPISVRAHLATSDLRLENILSEGVLDLAAGQPGYRGTVTAGPGALGTLPFEKLSGDVAANPPLVTLERGNVRLLGGTTDGRLRLASAGPDAGFTAHVEATGLDLSQLPASRDRPRAAGKLELHADLEGPPPGGPGFREGLHGNGRFAVADGRLTGIPLGRTLRDALATFLGTEASSRLRERYPDLFGGDDLRFTKLAGSGRLAGGRIRSDDLALAAPSYEAHGAGTLGFDGHLDVTLRLAASPALTDDLVGHSRARAVLVDERGQLTVPLRIEGPLRRPRVTPDPAFAATVARGLLPSGTVGDAVGSALEQLLGGKRRGGR